jgi:ADP-heptose:LPS heptosyltransferase
MNLKLRDNLLILTMHALNRMGKLKVKSLSQIDVAHSKGILVVVTTALGDAIFCTPLIKTLRKALPDKKIGLLVHHSFQTIFQDDENLDVVIPYHGKFKKVRSIWRKLKTEGFDVALVANMNDPDVIPLLYWTGTRSIIRRPWKSTIYPYLISNPEMMARGEPPDHAIPLNLKMAEVIGLKTDNGRTYTPLNKESQEKISNLLRDTGVGDGEMVIGFHPGASLESKMWPLRNYVDLAERIRAVYPGVTIVLTGSKKEAPLCGKIEQQISTNVLNTSGRLSLREVVALLERLTLFVSGDTGPFHIANSFGVRTVTIFGPSDDKTNGPIWDLDIHRVIKNRLECYYENCVRWCKKPECIRDIPVATVYEECMSLLDAGRPAR